MRPASRVLGLAPSASLQLAAEVRRRRQAGHDVVDFGVGDLDFPAPAAAKAGVREALDLDLSHYTPTVGTAELRAAIAADLCRRHGVEVGAADVVVGAGAKTLLYELLQAYVEPGDDVVVQVPCWVSFPSQVALAGGRFVPAPGEAADGFVPRARHFEAAFTPATRVVVANSPCNPTGAVMPEEEVAALVEACARQDAFLIFDEVYDGIVHEGRHVSPLAFRDLHPDGIACVGSASKSFAMTGWRVGHAVAPGTPANTLARLQDHVTSCANALGQQALLACLTTTESELPARVEELRARRDLALAALADCPSLQCPPPAGAFFLFPSVRLGEGGPVPDVDRLATHLLEQAGVAVVPGTAFEQPGHVRLSFAVSRADLERGLERLVKEMARLAADSRPPPAAS